MLPNQYPDPYYTIRKIRTMNRYIEEHSAVRINKVPLTVINSMLLNSLKDCEPFVDNDVFNTQDPSFFCCFSVFYHIYLSRYREYDLTSFDNFQTTFIDFQRFLWEIAGIYKRHGGWIKRELPDLKLFDLKNTTDNIDAITRWKKEF